jgi:pimeloyl-ACP methyl ester carboxylesterase
VPVRDRHARNRVQEPLTRSRAATRVAACCCAALAVLAGISVPGAASAAKAAPGSAAPAREESLKQALVIRIPEDLRSRTGMGLDPIEAKLVVGHWSAPHAGESVTFADGAVRSWRAVEADAKGWFERDEFEGGYAYFAVTSKTRRVVLLEGMGHDMVFVNGEPRGGNQYGLGDEWEPWEPHFNYSLIPIELRKGRNELLFKCYRGRLKVTLRDVTGPALLNARDLTIPDLAAGTQAAAAGGIVVINASTEPLRGAWLSFQQDWGGSRHTLRRPVPVIGPLSTRKVIFDIAGPVPAAAGPVAAELALERRPDGAWTVLDRATLPLKAVRPDEPYRRTFISGIDGSVQYYAVNPARGADRNDQPQALILSLHGADVEAINQATSYEPKTWANIVAPTNRRPYGYNWEDWGQIDALEALADASSKLNVDADRVYLTGHSMGGHGTWHIGETFPDRFGAIGPSAGWLSFWSYRARKAPDASTPVGAILARAASPSDTFALERNLEHLGVYLLHGADDDNVPVTESRHMVEELKTFHKDFVYHEQPGVKHWWDLSDEPGTDCVDWPPMFDFFARHARPGTGRARQVDFTTASPGISSRSAWLTIEAQTKPLALSSASIRFDPGLRRLVGTTSNVARLSFELWDLGSSGPITIELDGQKLSAPPNASIQPAEPTRSALPPGVRLVRKGDAWSLAGPVSWDQKGPHRYGTFKDAFRNRVMFVYGTKGTPEENAWAFAKARYDAERFWYQGNASVDVVGDVDFDPAAEPERNIVVYGNAKTNAAWTALLGRSPVQVDGQGITVGARRAAGADLACLFIRPRPGSLTASVGVVAGTGITGMRLSNNKLYLEAGYPFPDVLLFSAGRAAGDGILAAGFFDLDWSAGSDVVWAE